MKRVALARVVREQLRKDDLVICGLGSTEAAFREAGGPVGPTYFASDPMGLWPSVALGLALARPDHRVFLLAGDGDLLMNLQVLPAIASAPVKNLRIIVFHNGAYSCIGGQRLPGDERLSFATLATGSGFVWSRETRTENEVRLQLDELLAQPGPALLAARLEDEPCSPVPAGPWSQVEKRTMFMQAMAALDGR
jgi:thiamine pyrophosphate-dependent acetolactate synthase large subunit-like protein